MKNMTPFALLEKSAARGDQFVKALSSLITKASPRKGPGGRWSDTDRLNILAGGKLGDFGNGRFSPNVAGDASGASTSLRQLVDDARNPALRGHYRWGQAVVPAAFGRSANPSIRESLERAKAWHSAKPGSSTTDQWGWNLRDQRARSQTGGDAKTTLPLLRNRRDTASKLDIDSITRP